MDIEKIKKDFSLWIENKYNLYFIFILLFAFVIRIYYFSQTLNQPLWWDEAEYMMMAKSWAFNLDYNFVPVRPVLLSFITAIFFKFTTSEFLPRLLILVCSVSSIAGIYFLGKEIYNKQVGLIASFLMAVFSLDLFFSFRILVDTPSLTFFIFSALFFYKYFTKKQNKFLYIASILVAIGTLFKLTTATLLFAIVFYVLITEKLSLFKKKEYYIAVLIFVLILSPYIIWGYMQFQGFVITQAGAWNAPQGGKITNFFSNLTTYLSSFPTHLSWLILLFFIVSFALILFQVIIGFDLILKNSTSILVKNLFLLLIFIFPIIIPSYSVGFAEDRYVLLSFPAVFLITSFLINKSFNFLKTKNKSAAIIFLLGLLFFAGYYGLNATDSMVSEKLNSYSQLRDAGLWLKQNSLPTDIILTASPFQLGYYSDRDVIGFPSSAEELNQLILDNPNINYFTLSGFENHPEWTYSYPQENNLIPVQAYFADNQKTQPIFVIYKLN